MCWQTKKVFINILNKYHNNETDNYNASVKKMFKPAPLLDITISENPSPYENHYLSLSALGFLCHNLYNLVSPWAHPSPVHPVFPCQPLHKSPVFNSRVRHWYPPYMISDERYLVAHKGLFCCLIHVSILFYNSII